MLINCIECNLPVSDKADFCPHCGLPFNRSKSKNTAKSRKHRRLPNGFGQISKLNGYHRKPYRAMITVGKRDDGRPICKLLKPQSYFETYNEAYLALVEYNKNPYDLDTCMNLSELYNVWLEEYRKHLKSESSLRTIESAWRYCSALYNMPVKNIKANHLKGCIDNAQWVVDGEVRQATPNIKSRIKSMFNLMFDFAVQNEIASQNVSRLFSLGEDKPNEQNAHKCFEKDEIETLWANSSNYLVSIILVQIYSGWRPQELGLLRVEDVDLENWTFRGGMKTEAGTNRVVPIHPKIREIIMDIMDKNNRSFETSTGQLANADYKSPSDSNSSEYLFTAEDGSKLTYDKYAKRFKKIIKRLGLNDSHRPHDPRKHFITMCKNADVDEYAIKLIVGHNISDITEKVYTERSVEWLHKEIAKIS